jgi:hypothetical protein
METLPPVFIVNDKIGIDKARALFGCQYVGFDSEWTPSYKKGFNKKLI